MEKENPVRSVSSESFPGLGSSQPGHRFGNHGGYSTSALATSSSGDTEMHSTTTSGRTEYHHSSSRYYAGDMKLLRPPCSDPYSASLMRNVKREKTHSGINNFNNNNNNSETSQSTEKMQTAPDSCNDTENDLNNKASSSDDDEHEKLQMEYELVVEENRKLKQKTQKKDVLKRKILMMRKENETLKVAQDQQAMEALIPDSSEATNSPKENNSKEPGVFSKSFLLVSTLGGLYIEPFDGVNGTNRATSPSSSAIFIANNNSSTSPGSAGYTSAPIKAITSSIATQTLPTFHTTNTPKTSYHGYSPRVKMATTEEDEEAHRFVQEFKARRISLKLTQSDIGEELNMRAGARYGQSYISRMESMQLSTAIVLRMKPLLLGLLKEKEDERDRLRRTGDFDEEEYHHDRKRKKRTNFSPEQSVLLTKYFENQPRPSAGEIDEIARKIDVDRNSVKCWFNNKRQADKLRVTTLPSIGSINSVGSLNPYTNPYSSMPAINQSFLMSGLMQNAMSPIVTTASLNNLKLDYNLAKNLQPNTTLSLENVSLAATQAPFVFNSKELNSLYNAETAARLSNAVCSNMKKESPNKEATSAGGGGGNTNDSNTPFSLSTNTANPFLFQKELSSLYQNRTNSTSEDSPTQKLNNDLAQLYKDRQASMNQECRSSQSPNFNRTP